VTDDALSLPTTPANRAFLTSTSISKHSLNMQGMVDEAKAFLETAEGQDFEKDMQESFLAGSPSSQTQWAQRILAEKEKRESQGNAGQGQDSTSGMNSGKPGLIGDICTERAGRKCPARSSRLHRALST
jgi:hypothetical protein